MTCEYELDNTDIQVEGEIAIDIVHYYMCVLEDGMGFPCPYSARHCNVKEQSESFSEYLYDIAKSIK